MNPKTFASLAMPYLQAIQRFPGDTASEKLSWFGRFVLECKSYLRNCSPIPPELHLLFIVELSEKIKVKDYALLTHALKFGDMAVVSRVLRVTWFFEGTDETVNCEYFWTNIFPFVSVHTRTRMVKTLGRRAKNPIFAQQMFAKLETAYNVKTALSLIVCCEKNFIFDTVVRRKFLLPNGILKKIFRRNLELGLQLLLEYIEHYESYLKNTEEFMEKKSPQVQVETVIKKYLCFLHVLAKHNPRKFANIIRSVLMCSSEFFCLSNKCAKKFLKGAIDIVAANPELYLNIFSVKIVSAKEMEILLPTIIKNNFCNTDKTLTYLRHYPVKKQLELLFNVHKKFHHDFLHHIQIVTPSLLLLLPINQRINVTKKLMKQYPQSESSHYEKTWICYLPIKKSISTIKGFLNQASQREDKVRYISYILYTCMVNNNKEELSKTLTYILNEGYIENMEISDCEKLISHIMKICTLYGSLENNTLVFKIIKKFFVKYGYVQFDFLEILIHFRLLHNLEVTDLMSMFFITHDSYMSLRFRPPHNLQRFRLCLLAFMDFIEKHYINWYEEDSQEQQANKDEERQQQNRNEIKRISKIITLCAFVAVMYKLNTKFQMVHIHIKRMTIKNYPMLLDTIRKIMCSQINFHFRKTMQKLLRQYEGELYRSWFLANTSENIADVTSGAALRLLKRNPQSVLDNWEEYLTSCKKHYRQKHVQRFLRAVCWYKDIPIKFAKRCIDNLNVKNIEETLSDLIVLGILLGSETFKKLLKSFLSKEIKLYDNRVDIRNTDDPMLASILRIFTLCNLPVPMEIVANLFTESQLCVEKSTLLRVIVRVSSDDVLLFEERLPMMCTLMRKHWIDLMCSIKPLNFRIYFLQKMWHTEADYMVRENVLENSLVLFRNIPQSLLLLLYEIGTSFTFEDVHLLKKWEEHSSGIDKINFLFYCKLWLTAIKRVSETRSKSNITREQIFIILKKLDALNSSPDFLYFMANFIFGFLFSENAQISSIMRYYTLLYFSESFHKGLNNREIYWQIITNILRRLKVDLKRFYSLDFNYFIIHPMKTAVHVFLNEFVIRYIKLYERFDYAVIINYLLNIFSLKSSRWQNAKTYLLLKYAWILYDSKKIHSFTEFDFGRKLACCLPDLVDTFSEFLVSSVMTEILELFVKIIYGSDNYSDIMDLITDGIMSVNNAYVIFMTMMILPSMQEKTQGRSAPDILQISDSELQEIKQQLSESNSISSNK